MVYRSPPPPRQKIARTPMQNIKNNERFACGCHRSEGLLEKKRLEIRLFQDVEQRITARNEKKTRTGNTKKMKIIQ